MKKSFYGSCEQLLLYQQHFLHDLVRALQNNQRIESGRFLTYVDPFFKGCSYIIVTKVSNQFAKLIIYPDDAGSACGVCN